MCRCVCKAYQKDHGWAGGAEGKPWSWWWWRWVVGERAGGCLGKAAGRSREGFSGAGFFTWQLLMVQRTPGGHTLAEPRCAGVRLVVCTKGRLVSSVVLLLLLWAGASVPGGAAHLIPWRRATSCLER